MGNSFAVVVSTLTDNDTKALSVVPGEIPLKHGGLAEDEDDDGKLDIRGRICSHMPCTGGTQFPPHRRTVICVCWPRGSFLVWAGVRTPEEAAVGAL